MIANQLNSISKKSNTRWYVLTFTTLTAALVVAMPAMAMPVLFAEISQDLGLTLVQIGMIWGFGSLAGIFTGMFGGSIGDRYGTNRTLMLACILTGIAIALRGFAGNFVTLSIIVLLGGFLGPAIPSNLHKVCGCWFSGKRLGMANGIVAAGMAFGFMAGSMISATLLSPWLGGWRNVFIFYGVISVGIGLAWQFMPKDPQGGNELPNREISDISLRQTLPYLLRLKNIWLLSIAILGIGGCIQGLLGYLPLYLRDIGWTATAADGTLATFSAVSMLTVIPITLLSDRIGKRKLLLIISCLMTTIGVGMLYFVAGPLVWVAIILAGFSRDGFMALFITMITETEGVGPALTGTAMGLVMISSRIGGLIAPPLGNSLAEIDLSLPFLFWAAMAFISFICFHFVKEKRELAG